MALELTPPPDKMKAAGIGVAPPMLSAFDDGVTKDPIKVYPANYHATYSTDSSGNLTLVAPTGAAVRSLQSPVIQNRQQRIAGWKKQPKLVAPLWTATTVYPIVTGGTWVTGNVVQLANGAHLELISGGTSGSTMPVVSQTTPAGRPITDGTVTWRVTHWEKLASDANAPIITKGTSPAALGLTTAWNATFLSPATGKGIYPVAYNSTLNGFTFAIGNTSFGGGATAQANAAGFTGDSFAYDQTLAAYEFYVTDTCIGISNHNGNIQTVIEVDGQLLQCDPHQTYGINGYTVKFDFGIMAKRKVRIINGGIENISITTNGRVEAGTSASFDSCLILGDSYWNTGPQNNGFWNLAGIMGYELGFDSIVPMNVGGSGYNTANANTYNPLAVVTNANNVNLITNYYKPGHVVIGAGFNDTDGAALGAAMLTTWKAIRALLPYAKISVVDCWAGSSGPDANRIAISSRLKTQFAAWGDANSRFIDLGTSGGNASSLFWGTGNASIGITAGNASYLVSSDATHPSGLGHYVLGKYIAAGINAAWGGDY